MQQGISDLLLAGEERGRQGSFLQEGRQGLISCLTFLGDFLETSGPVKPQRDDGEKEISG